MSVPVWTWPYAADGVRQVRAADVAAVPLGDGKWRTGLRSFAWTHQDGTGGADTSHVGTATFTVQLPPVTFGGGVFTGVLDFLQARLAGNLEAFYLYDPNVTPDSANWDGVTTAGRHLVKHLDGKIGWRMLHKQMCQFDRFTFHEVQP